MEGVFAPFTSVLQCQKVASVVMTNIFLCVV